MIAEKLGMTVRELMTGKRGPISTVEFNEWVAYMNVKSDIEKQASAKARQQAGR